MTKKIVPFLLLSAGLYTLLTMAVIHCYQDDPSTMKWHDRENYNQRFISQLGDTETIPLDVVLDKLGSPDLAYVKQVNEQTWQLNYYRTQHVTSDGITTIDECTGLLFINNQLVSWGGAAVSDYQNS